VKKTWMYILLLPAMAGLASGYCQGANQPATITLTTDNPTIKAGADVWVKVVMTNTSSDPIDCSVVSSNGADRRYSFAVWGPTGAPLSRKPLKHPELEGGGSIHMCTLNPKDSTTAEENLLSRLFDLTEPGTYTVQLSRMFDVAGSQVRVKSNKLEIQVTP